MSVTRCFDLGRTHLSDAVTSRYNPSALLVLGSLHFRLTIRAKETTMFNPR